MGSYFGMTASGLLAIGLYMAILWGFFYQYALSKFQPIEYAPKTQTIFEVSIVPPAKKEPPPKKPTPPSAPPKTEPMPESKESTSKTPKVGVAAKDLFSEVETKAPAPKEDEFVRDLDDILAKRKQAWETKQAKQPETQAQKIVQNIQLSQTVAITPSKGVSDEYVDKISQILHEGWQRANINVDHALVQIFVSKTGQFDYKIMRPGTTDAFNRALHTFLQQMEDKDFPPYESGEQIELEVKFGGEE